MRLSYRYRLYPTREQKARLEEQLDLCRSLYNLMLDQMRFIEREEGRTPSRFELQSLLPILKQEHPEFQAVNSKALQMVLHQLYSNLKALSGLKKKGKKVGGLRFKGWGWYKTITFNQSGFKINGRKLWLSKIGEINIKLHRPVDGEIKQVKVKREQTGKWFAILAVEQEVRPQAKGAERKVGIDLGIYHYVADTSGLFVEHPHNIKKAEKKLAREQRRLSRKKEGSSNRAKQRLKVAGVHERVANQRRDFLHKLSRYYVDSYSFIAVEDLDCKEMMETAHNARSHADSSWAAFLQMLGYKAERAGVRVVRVDPENTSQLCSSCGNYVEKGLWERVHSCPVCGFEADRDYNASLNILKRALISVGQGLPESTPVETGPPPGHHVPASLVVEAGSPLR
jgi:putative transposase